MAVPLRIERVGIRSLAGQAKVLGTVVCVGGVMVMTFYKGITLHMWSSPFHLSSSSKNGNASQSKDWIKGSLLVVSSCISWSALFILQAKIGKTYSAQYSSTALMCFLVTIQSGVLTLIFERGNLSVWALGMDVRLLAAVYSGVVATAMAFCIMSWCIARKGPLFVTMFNPLLLIFVAVMSSLILDEKLHMGSVIGSILIVIGLYAVLWGKGKEMTTIVKVPKRDLAEISSAHDLSIHSEHSNSKEAINIQHENRDDNPVRKLKDEEENPDCSMVQIDSVQEIVAIEEENSNSNSTGMSAES